MKSTVMTITLLPLLLLLPSTLGMVPSPSVEPIDGSSSSVSQAAPSTSGHAGTGGTYNQLIISSRDNLCLSVSGGNAATVEEGMNVQSLPCPSATTWNINRGQGSIVLASNSGFALDFGTSQKDHGELKLQKSTFNSPQQTWYFTNDNYIAVYNGTHCLDEGVNGAQLYTCQTNNGNQVWYVMDAEHAPDASMAYTYVSGIANLITSSDAATSTSSAAASASSVAQSSGSASASAASSGP